MRILGSSQSVSDGKPCAVALGIFDGVHRGHRVLLGRSRELAAADAVESLVYTFHPHPAQVLVPARAPRLIEPIEIRLERFAGMGLDVALVERFSAEFAAMPPETFVRELLFDKLQARHVVVGAGFTFGAGGRGTTELLTALARERGAQVHVIDPVLVDGERVSSTQIRHLVATGDVRKAAKLLGRPFTLTGLVVRGRRRGRDLGFGTANLSPVGELQPDSGVYAAIASGPIGTFQAVVNIGTTPTFGNNALKVEAHLLGFEGRDLYGTTIALDFIDRLRNERRFDSVEALKAQISCDIDRAKEILAASLAR
jgi:riboflavin kinase / FMN adenylyltransferase